MDRTGKRVLAVAFAAFFCICALLSPISGHTIANAMPAGEAVVPQRISDETVPGKTVLSEQMPICLASPPSLELNVKLCDLAIVGKITEIKETGLDLATGTELDEKLKAQNQGTLPQTPATLYRIKIQQTLIGEADSKEIIYMEHGHLGETVTKPSKNQKVVLFLNRLEDGTYTTVCLEHSIFTVNEREELYAYSNRQCLSQYDKKDCQELIKDVKELLKKGSNV